MYQNNSKNTSLFLKIGSAIIVILLGLIAFLIVKISPPVENKSIQQQTEQIISDINSNNTNSQFDNGQSTQFPTSEIEQIVDIFPTETNNNAETVGQTETTDPMISNPTTGENIIVGADASGSNLNSFVKNILSSGDEVLIIPKSYAGFPETVDYPEIKLAINNPLLTLSDQKYFYSYQNNYIFIRDKQTLKFTSENAIFLDSFQYKNKQYWVTLVQGIGGVGKILLSEPGFINQIEIPDFKDDLIIEMTKKNNNNGNYEVEVTNGNGLNTTNSKYEIDLKKIIDGGNSALVK